MTYQLNFEKLLNYDAGDVGINLEITLKLSERSVGLTAKVDTGASCCIFERRHGEQVDYEGKLYLNSYDGPE